MSKHTILPRWFSYLALGCAGVSAVSLSIGGLIAPDTNQIARALGFLSCQVIVAAIIIADAICRSSKE